MGVALDFRALNGVVGANEEQPVAQTPGVGFVLGQFGFVHGIFQFPGRYLAPLDGRGRYNLLFGGQSDKVGFMLPQADAVIAGNEAHPVGDQDNQDEAHEIGEKLPHFRPGDVLGEVVGPFQNHLEHVIEAGRHFIGRAGAGAQAEHQQQHDAPGHQRRHERIEQACIVEQKGRHQPFRTRIRLAGQLDEGQNWLGISDDRAEDDHQYYKNQKDIALLHIAVLSLSS